VTAGSATQWFINATHPECGTSGSHPGLIYIVAEELPGLKYIYKRYYFLGYVYEDDFPWYDWASTLANFLGFKDKIGLTDWAKDNPKIWGIPFQHPNL
jgi:hypothetical protein